MEQGHDTPKVTGIMIFRHYAAALKRYPTLLVLALCGMVGLQITGLVGPWYLRQFFDTLASAQPNASTVAALLWVVGILAVVYVADQMMRRLRDFSLVILEPKVMQDLYERSFEYLIGHSYSFFISRFSGSLTHRISKYARAFESLLDSFIMQFIPTILFVVGAVTVLFLRNHMLGIALGAWSVCFVIFILYVSQLRQPLRIARAEADTKSTAALADAISNHQTIMLFAGESHERSLFGAVASVWRRATIRSWVVDNFIWAGVGFSMIAIEIGLMWGTTVLWGKGLVTVGDFVLVQSYLMTTFDRLIAINMELRRFYDALADATEMTEILEMPHAVADVPDAKDLKVGEGAIGFRHVHFSFHADHDVFADLTLAIKGSEKVAFVGPSGAGKSTVTKLLLRFFDVTSGAIEIDGQNIARVTQESLRSAIAYVPQEPILFHRTLMENIRYGRRDATDAEVMEAARQAHCHEFIMRLPEGYESLVGERGVKLSGGERQRVAIARAILKNAPILLLDEATSSLDSESEALIQESLESLMQGKTVITIAHRLSTIMKMDRIVVIDKGQIVAQGTHEELLASDSLYQKLWSIQVGGFLPDEEE